MRLFSSKLRVNVLTYFSAHTRECLYIRELARILDASAGTLSKELENLEKAGILISNYRGNQKYYSLNRQCPFIDDLLTIFIKAIGTGEDKAEKPPVCLTGDEETILKAIGVDGARAEDLVIITGFPAAVLQRSLVMLELKGCISISNVGRYYRK